MAPVRFSEIARLGEQLEGTSKRGALTELLALFLRRLAPEEIPPAVRMIVGRVFAEWDDRPLNVSWRAVMAVVDELVDASPETRQGIWSRAVDGGEAVRLLLEQARRNPPAPPELVLLEVFGALQEVARIAGSGSHSRKEKVLRGLFARATPIEAKFLSKVIFQEMRHGVSEGIMLEGIAKAAGLRPALLRRAHQFWGDLGEVAQVALTQGADRVKEAAPRLFRPLKPMLADSAEQLSEAFERYGDRFALEYKLDGARVQVHRRSDKVHIYSRNLAEVSPSLPDVVEQVRAGLSLPEAILDGEVVAVDSAGRPLPFQELMRRFRRKHGVKETLGAVPVQLHLFDILYADGEALVDLPNETRWATLQEAAGGLKLVRRLVSPTPLEARSFAEAAHRDGHEGVMAKDLDSAYTPGVRGRSWLKLKHVFGLDLVIVAADWGYGRRHGWLSNYHLAALDQQSGEYLVVGKTFKGLTDDEFRGMTARLLALELSRDRGTVFVRPGVVVEVQFNEIQASSQYRSGLALRFARISRVRDDKAPSDADTIQSVRRLYERQFESRGTPSTGLSGAQTSR